MDSETVSLRSFEQDLRFSNQLTVPFTSIGSPVAGGWISTLHRNSASRVPPSLDFPHEWTLILTLEHAKDHQVTPFEIRTPDGETLYCWHIMPLQLYSKHEQDIKARSSVQTTDFTKTVAYDLLEADSEARIVVNCTLFSNSTSHTITRSKALANSTSLAAPQSMA